MINTVQKFVQSLRSNVAAKSRRLSGRRIPRLAQVLEERVLLESSYEVYRIEIPGVPTECTGQDIWFRFTRDLTGVTTLPSATFTYVRLLTPTDTYVQTLPSPARVLYTLPSPNVTPYGEYDQRFLDAAPQSGAAAVRPFGLYTLTVTSPGMPTTLTTQFDYIYIPFSGTAADAITGLTVTGPLIATPDPGEGPVALLLSEGSSTSVTATWNANTNPPTDYYVYELGWLPTELPVTDTSKEFPNTYTTKVGPTATTSNNVTFTDLTFGTYVLRVKAVNCRGEGQGWVYTSFVVSDPANVRLFDNHEDQCPTCSGTMLDGENPEPTTTAESFTGTTATAVAGELLAGVLSGFKNAILNSSANPHPVTMTSFRLPYKSTELILNATQASGPASDEPPVTVITGIAVTGKLKPVRVEVPGQLSTTAGASGLKDANHKLRFRLPLPAWDGVPQSDFVGAVKPTDKVPVLDRTLSPLGRRVGFAGDDFLDVSLVATGGAPALIRGNGTVLEYSGAGPAGWNSPAGSFTTITRPGGTGDFVVTNQLGDKWIFDGSGTNAKGVLKEIMAWTGERTIVVRSSSDLNADGVLNDLTSVEYRMANNALMDSVTYTWAGSNITAVTDLDGRVWTYAYGASNLLTSVTGPANDVVTQNHDGNGLPALPNVERAKTILTYKPSDPTFTLQSIERTDEFGSFSEKSSFIFDQWRNVVSITQESGSGNRTWGFNSAESKVLDGQYLWVLPETPVNFTEITWVTGPEDTITLPNNDVIKRQVDLFGNTLKETHNYSNSGFGGARQAVTQYERNVHGQVRRTTGTYIVGQTAAPLVTDYTYDALRRLTTILYPDATTETWVFDAAGLTGPHQPGTYTNRVGHKTTYGYTSGQQTSSIVRNATNVFMYETQMTWSGMMVTSTTLPSVNGGASGDTSRPAIKYFYDSRGRLIHQRRTSAGALNSAPLATDIWSSQGYNALGNVSFVTSEYSNPVLDGNGLPTGLGNTLKTEFLTTALGDVRRMTQPDPDGVGSLVRPVYDYSLDAQGRVLTSIEPGPGTVAERTTTIDWNDFGELKTLDLPDPDGGATSLFGNRATYAYDSIGFATSIKTSAIGGPMAGVIVKSEFFKFNSRGELEWQSLPYGADKTAPDAADRTLFNYDAFSRLVRQEVQSGLAGTSDYQVTQWDYDDLNRKMTVTDAAGSGWKTYFDALGRITKTETPDPDDNGSNVLLTTLIEYFDGNTAYGIVGTCARITDPRGHVSWTKSSPSGQILLDEPGDPDGAGPTPQMWTRYNYDSFDRLDMMGERYGATYTAPLTLATERITDYNYNSRSQITHLITPDPDIVGGGLLTPLTTVYAYDNLGRNTSVTTPSGLVTNSVWRVDGVLTNESRVDNDGNAANDWTVAYNYDNWDRLVSMVTPQSLAGAGLATTSYAYNQRGDLASTTAPDPDGGGPGLASVMTYGYDSVNAGIFVNSVTTSASVGTATTALVYDRAGRLREQKRPDPVTGSPVAYATEKWTYDKLDRLTSALVIKPQSGTTSETATYDALNYAYDRLSRLKQVDDGNLNRAELTTYRNDGDVHQTTDALGRVVEYAYDKWGRVTDTKRLVNNAVYDTTHTTYDGFGRVSSVTERFNLATTEHIVTSFAYDNLDRLTTRSNAVHGVNGVIGTNVTLWNNKGQVSRVTNEYNQPTIYAWDDAGRLKESKFTLNLQQMNYTYDAYDRVVSETDANGNTTTYEYDNAGRRTKMTGPSVSGTPAIVTYTWDTPGNMLSLTDSAPAVNGADAVGNTTSWRYDKRNRMQFEDIVLNSATPLVLSSRENQYYLNDTVRWTKDRDFNWIEYKYNFVMGDYQVGQERWWKTGVNYINDINYQYNDPKGLLLTDVYERSPGTTQVNNHIEFDYDGLARATKVKTYLTGNGAVAAQGGVVAVAASAVSTTFDVDHTWDSSDRRDLTAFYFNDQTTTLKKQEFRNDYTWDKLHRLDLVTQQVSSAATSWVVDAARTKSGDFEYYPNSQLKKITRLQGTNTTALITDYKQNAPDDHWVPGRISKVEHSGLATGTQITSNDFDVAGRIIQKVTPAQTYNYAYDGTDQLTTVTNASGSTLLDPNFNAVGNDTSHTVSYYNRVLNDGTYTYEYNNEGSRTKRTKIIGGSYDVYAYDHRQRLTSVKSYTLGNVETSDVRYEYDALDRRFRRKVDTNNNDTVFEVNQRLLYDTNPVNPEFDEVIQIIDDSTGNRQHRFLNGPQPDMVLTDEIFTATGTPNDILWLLQDHQNSVTDVATLPTSGLATLRNHLEYNAFGQITSQTDSTHAPVQTYTGQILDTTTGLLYYDARWYDPQLGRFISNDPIDFAAGDANLTRYVGNSWPNWTDPTGLDEIVLNPDGSTSTVTSSGSIRGQMGIPSEQAGWTVETSPFRPPSDVEVDARNRRYVESERRKEAARRARERQSKLSSIADPDKLLKHQDNQTDGKVILTPRNWIPPEAESVLANDRCDVMVGAHNAVGDIIEAPINGLRMLPGGGAAKVTVYYLFGEEQEFLSSYAEVVLSVVPYAIPRGPGTGTGLLDDAFGVSAAGAIEVPAGERAFFDFIRKRKDIDPSGFLDIAIHGSPQSVLVRDGVLANHRVLAGLIESNSQFTGQSIRLLSCNTGATNSGFAQDLANKLNTTVVAPNRILWATESGTYFVAGGKKVGGRLVPDFSDLGSFVPFVPKKGVQ